MPFFRRRPAKQATRSGPSLSARRARLRLESVEERLAPAVFNILPGDTAGLIAAVTTSNTNNEADVINLAVGATYTFAQPANTAQGPFALPAIVFDTADTNTLTINGNGSTFNRTGVEEFRFILVSGSSGKTTLDVNGVTFNNGFMLTEAGGAIAFGNNSQGSITDCTFTNNQANDGGAVVALATEDRAVTITNSKFSNNTATAGRGGAILSQGTTTVTLNNSTVTLNRAALDGGGVWFQTATTSITLNINNSFITQNSVVGTTNSGGGIFCQGNLNILGSDISQNTTGATGGGVFVQGDLNIRDSSVTRNSSETSTASGGGIFVQGTTVNITQVTIDNNRAGNGGGLNLGVTVANIKNSTISDNHVFFGIATGGGINILTGTVRLANSIVAGNYIETSGTGPDIAGDIISQGYNLIGIGDGATITGDTATNITGALGNPALAKLDVLGDYGGNHTLLRPLLPGSPALDRGDPGYLPPPDFDQRSNGFPRVIGGRIDIGAFEAPVVDLSVVKDNGTASAVPGQNVVYTIVVTNNGPGDANGARFSDILSSKITSATWTAVFSSGATGTTSGVGSIDEVINLPLGATAVYTLTCAIDPSAFGDLVNTATILPPAGVSDPVGDDNTATDTDTLTPVADAFVVKQSAGSFTPDGIVVYTVTVGNKGPSTAANMSFFDILPPEIVSATWTSTATGGATGNAPSGSGNILQILTVPPSGSIVYTIRATISSDAQPGNLTNSASLNVPVTIADPNTANNVAVDSVPITVGKLVVATAPDAGQVPLIKLYNPLSGKLRTSFYAYNPSFTGGVRIATADFNGDGSQDIVTAPGPGGGPHIRVFDGVTASMLGEFFAYDVGFTGGVYVAAADVNGDHHPDIITGAGAGGGPHVRVFDGATGGIITEYFAYSPAFTGGVRVAAGDVNHDGRADVLTGAGPGGGPHVQVFDSTSGAVIRSFFAYPAGFTGGVWVTAGDYNGDGYADIVTGAGEGGGPLVRFFDGRNGIIMRDFYAYPRSVGSPGRSVVWSSGVRVSMITDMTGDGIPDLITAPGRGQQGQVRFYDGNTLTMLYGFMAYDPTLLGGVFVAATPG